MSVSAASPPQAIRRASRSGQHSATLGQLQEANQVAGRQSSHTHSPSRTSPAPKPGIRYTVFVRLPFIRGSFEDPPPVEWNATRDKALWKLISKANNANDLDWDEIAIRFDVSLAFLLQQAAWLYERHLKGLRGTVQKLGAGGGIGSPTPPHPPPADAVLDQQRPVSKDGRMLTPINTSRREGPLPGAEVGSAGGTPRANAPAISRNPSTSTVTQSKMSGGNQRAPLQHRFRGSSGSQGRAAGWMRGGAPPEPERASDSEEESSASLTERNTDSAKNQNFRRQAFGKKPANPRTLSPSADAENEDDDESSGEGFLPFAAASRATGSSDPAATLRSPASKQRTTGVRDRQVDSSESSASSARPSTMSREASQTQHRPGPLSPKHRAQLEQLSPKLRKSGSDGTPSMGSSFSDLDDMSITQSALEEAVLSKAGNASIASRMSTLGNAWKGGKK